MKQQNRTAWKHSGVEIGSEVDCAKIAAEAVIHPGCRIRGEKSSIGPGCVIGAEAPATLENCQLGKWVTLKGGFFSGSVFFSRSGMGSAAQTRAGSILEEEARGGHTVGLKQTVLMPFVTLGSLINFCDVLMAGGSGRKNHSEVGSAYVHFNFTPRQDKAAASLMGDVPGGVFLDRNPIFLGGQGGLTGPSRIAYGSVIVAGGVCRRDILEENRLYIPKLPAVGMRRWEAGVYRKIDRIVRNNLTYIGNIAALRAWYTTVRILLAQDEFDRACVKGGIENLNLILAERIGRLEDLAEKMEASIKRLQRQADTSVEIVNVQKSFQAAWPAIKQGLYRSIPAAPGAFIEGLKKEEKKGNYIGTIQALDRQTRETGRVWLQSIVNDAEKLWHEDVLN